VTYEALLLDVGYVIIDVTWRAVDALGRATGWPMPEPGDMSPTPAYWEKVAVEAGFDGFTGLFRALCATVPDEVIDPAPIALLGDARSAGRRTGVLSNDAYTFIGREFFTARPEFAELDAFIDASEIGVSKPDAEAYLRAATALGVKPDAVVFLDDTPECVDGAARVGMAAVRVDPFDKTPAFDRARELLGLS
jgi:phosphoglycolate phosphatase-like HAD superfamily hydrolase